MPFTNQKAGKHAQAEFLKNPEFSAMISKCKYLERPSEEAGEKIASKFTKASDFSFDELPRYVHASDGSFYEASLEEGLPSTKMGYVKISSLLINLPKYLDLGSSKSRYIDPFKKSELEKDTRSITMCLPSSNLIYGDESKNVADGFRLRLFEELNGKNTVLPKAGTLLDTLYELACFEMAADDEKDNKGKQGFEFNGEKFIIVSKCPNCNAKPITNTLDTRQKKIKGFIIPQSKKYTTCAECKSTVYASDGLRLYETITDHGGLSGGLSRIMNISEMLLIAHTIINSLNSDYCGALSHVCFFIDGPLAIFGQPAWVSRPMQHLIWKANDTLKAQGHKPMIIIGIQKQGILAEHCGFISQYLVEKGDSYRFVDDHYRNSYLTPVKNDHNFGNETYFGQDIIYYSPKGNIFALGIPYPLPSKSNHLNFKEEKSNIDNYPDLERILGIVKIFESDLYQGSLVPIIMAHRNASISRVPGGKILDIASKIAFDRSKSGK